MSKLKARILTIKENDQNVREGRFYVFERDGIVDSVCRIGDDGEYYEAEFRIKRQGFWFPIVNNGIGSNFDEVIELWECGELILI